MKVVRRRSEVVVAAVAVVVLGMHATFQRPMAVRLRSLVLNVRIIGNKVFFLIFVLLVLDMHATFQRPMTVNIRFLILKVLCSY